MCWVAYLASDEPLPLVEWQDDARGFHLIDLRYDADRKVLDQFDKPHIYYMGSHIRCGCGFNYGQFDYESDPEKLAEKRETMRQMSEYLAEQLPRIGQVEIFFCWDGDQRKKPAHRRELTPSALLAEDFAFLEGELSVIKPDPAG